MEDLRSNPFPGLRPFNPYFPEEDEHDLFFGREGQSTEIQRRLRETRFLAVVGTSGSGKSSLIRAGLLPDLFGGFLSPGTDWRMAIFRPIGDPIGNLARALNKPDVLQTEIPAEGEEAASDMLLEVTLRRSGLGIIEAARLARLPANQNLLVVVDQFEELFRFADGATTTAQADDAAGFVKLLLEATRQTEIPIYVVITMRSDFIGDCARYQELPEAVTEGMYLIPRMTREQRRSAIKGPVAVGGGAITPRLVNRLLNEVGDNPDQLPVLQHALMRTWDHWVQRTRGVKSLEENAIDFEDYEAIGGLESALSNHADEAFHALRSERHREIARRMFQCLTERSADNREVRRPTSVGEIATVAHATLEETIEVIEEFRRQGRSFLNTPEKGALRGQSLIDISHESLIRLWARLRTWANEEAESAQTYRRLADAAQRNARGRAELRRGLDLQNYLAWKERDQPTAEWAKRYDTGIEFSRVMEYLERSCAARAAEEAREKGQREEKLRLAKRNLLVVSAFAVIAVALGVFGLVQMRIAQRQATAAEAATARATTTQLKADQNAKLADEHADLARRERDEAERAEQERHIESLLARKLRWDTTGNQAYLLNELIQQSAPIKAASWHIWKASLLLLQGKLDSPECNSEAGYFDSARCESDAAVNLAVDSYEARTTRGYMYMLKGEPAKAIPDFEYIREHIRMPLPLNSLNLAVALAGVGKRQEANRMLEQALEDSRKGDNEGGSEEQVPMEITEATGRTALAASPEAFEAALSYLRVNFDSYAGVKDIRQTLERADKEVKQMDLRPMDQEDACLVAITWAWLHEKARPQDYGTFAAEGMLWERAGYPEEAAESYEKFAKAHGERHEERYGEMAKWADAESAVARKAAASLPRMEHPAEPVELELESRIMLATGRLPEAEKLIDQAIAKDARNPRLYLRRADIHFSMAREPREKGGKLQREAGEVRARIEKLEKPAVAATDQLAGGQNGQKSGEAPQERQEPADRAKVEAEVQKLRAQAGNLENEAAKYQAQAKKLHEAVIADCERALRLRPGTSQAYVNRAYAQFFLRNLHGQDLPLATDDPILKDLRRALTIRPSRDAMSTLIYLLMGPDISKLPENDGRLEEALRLGLAFDRTYPGDADNLSRLAEIQYKKKQYSASHNSIEAAIRVEGSNLEYYDTRAKVETAMGLDQLQVQRQRARGYRRAADILRWSEKTEKAAEATQKSWEPMGEIAKVANNAEILCNPAMTVCTENRAVEVAGADILCLVESVVSGAGNTREVRIDRGGTDGIVLLTKGDLYATTPGEGGASRPIKKIGTGEVISVEPRTALIRVKMESPTGAGLVRPRDSFFLKARLPKGPERSDLWGLARFHITLVDQSQKKLFDYRTLYSQESPEVENGIYNAMLEDVHKGANATSANMKEVLKGGRFAGKTLREALGETSRADLESFYKYVLKNRSDYLSRDWKLTEIYKPWLIYGERSELVHCGIDEVNGGEGDARQARINRGTEDGVVMGSQGTVYAVYSKENDHERQAKAIGTGDVVAVEARSATVRVRMSSPTGDGLARKGDTVLLRVRLPEGPEASNLWEIATYNIALLDLDKKVIVDYRTMYGKDTPEFVSQLSSRVIEDIHAAAKKDKDWLNEKVNAGKFAGKTVRQALAETTRTELESFWKYVLRVPGTYFGHEWRVAEIYAWWVEAGMPEK